MMRRRAVDASAGEKSVACQTVGCFFPSHPSVCENDCVDLEISASGARPRASRRTTCPRIDVAAIYAARNPERRTR